MGRQTGAETGRAPPPSEMYSLSPFHRVRTALVHCSYSFDVDVGMYARSMLTPSRKGVTPPQRGEFLANFCTSCRYVF